MTKDILRDIMAFAQRVTRVYLSDLTNADLLVRPLPGMNHVAWQLGHLIRSEHSLVSRVGGGMPALPPEFLERHSTDAASSDDRAGLLSKDEYLQFADTVRTATLAALEATSEARLAEPVPETMHRYATTVAAVFRHVGTHELMHAGQIVAVRRKLGKPVLI